MGGWPNIWSVGVEKRENVVCFHEQLIFPLYMVVSQAYVLCSERVRVLTICWGKRVTAFDPRKIVVPKRKKVITV